MRRSKNGLSQCPSSSLQSKVTIARVGPQSRAPTSHRKTDLGIHLFKKQSAKVVLVPCAKCRGALLHATELWSGTYFHSGHQCDRLVGVQKIGSVQNLSHFGLS